MIYRVPLRETPWPKGQHATRPCPICAMRWVPWAGSRLQCHTRCLFTEHALDDIRASSDPIKLIAKRLGTTNSIIQTAQRQRERTRL